MKVNCLTALAFIADVVQVFAHAPRPAASMERRTRACNAPVHSASRTVSQLPGTAWLLLAEAIPLAEHDGHEQPLGANLHPFHIPPQLGETIDDQAVDIGFKRAYAALSVMSLRGGLDLFSQVHYGNGVGNGGRAGTRGTDSCPVRRPKKERLDVGANLQLVSDKPQFVEDGEGTGADPPC